MMHCLKKIFSDKEVIAACSNGNAGSSACASARLKAIASKEGYEDGPYNEISVGMLQPISGAYSVW